MYKKHEYNIKSLCPVCGHSVMIDEIGKREENQCQFAVYQKQLLFQITTFY